MRFEEDNRHLLRENAEFANQFAVIVQTKTEQNVVALGWIRVTIEKQNTIMSMAQQQLTQRFNQLLAGGLGN